MSTTRIKLTGLIRFYDTLITSRLNDPQTGKLVIIAHRLNERDLSAYVLELSGWHHVVLPLVAPRGQNYAGSRNGNQPSGVLANNAKSRAQGVNCLTSRR